MTSDLELCRAFLDAHPEDAARVLERVLVADAAAVLGALPTASAAGVFNQMSTSRGADCLAVLPPSSSAAIVRELRTDLASALLRRLDEPVRTAVLEALPHGDAGLLRTALRYPAGTAGALMDPRVMTVPDDVSAGEALTRVRRSPRHVIYYVYAVDRQQRLVGVVDLRELMLARPAEPFAGVMHKSVVRVPATAGRAALLAHPGWRLYHALPVVDEHETLLGVIRYQTFRRLEEESRGAARGSDASAAVFALGELYWLGLSGVLEGLASVVQRSTRPANGLEADRGTV